MSSKKAARMRREKAARDKANSTPSESPPPSTGVATAALPAPTSPSRWRNAMRKIFGRRTTWMVLACAVAGMAIYLNETKKSRVGYLVYSSDDPNAEVVIQKDDKSVTLERKAKLEVPLDPGRYTLRLVSPTTGYKLQPDWFNLDANGRAFVKVRRVE